MTNFEKIRNGAPQELKNMMISLQDDKCKFCIFNFENCNNDCKEGLIAWFDSFAPIELTQTEREICVGLKHIGFNYLARDEFHRIFACKTKPFKEGRTWNISEGDYTRMDIEHPIFRFIQWEDNKPKNITDLLG